MVPREVCTERSERSNHYREVMLSVQKSAEVIVAVFFQRRTESIGVFSTTGKGGMSRMGTENGESCSQRDSAERQVSRKPTATAKEQLRPPEKQSVLKHLREIQERNKQNPPQRQCKKSIDRDSR